MKQFVIHHLARQAERLGQLAVTEPPGTGADLVITLAGGSHIAVYVVNYGVRSVDLAEQLTTNTRHGVFSLYILDGRMLPADGALIEPPHWMTALHAVMHGRVYGYWTQGREVTIRPVHFEWRWGDERRRVLYGAPVEWGEARAGYVDSGSKYLPGRFAAAEFGEGAFWKKRDPNAGRQYKYSWRQWSAGSRATAGEPADSDEAFQRHYGDVWGDDARFRGRQQQQQRQQQQRQRARRPAAPRGPQHHHYHVLGIQHTASNEEVKRAYRRKARENHPDLHPAEREKYNLRMAEINAAFEAINREREGND